MRNRAVGLVVLALVSLLGLVGCGGGKHHTAATAPRTVPAYLAQCPQAANGHGAMGICSPRSKLQLLAPHRPPRPGVSSRYFLDLSNNDPCYCGAQIRDNGNSGLIVKANQGTASEFLDWTAVPMLNSARAAGLAIGVYDFDQDYSIAEAQTLVQQARAAGIYPNTRNAFPLYLDVEWGNFSLGGLMSQVNYLRSQGYRVGMYTGEWYYEPAAGCSLPPGLVSVWLSGYPSAFVWCGVYNYNAHQYTDNPVDRSVFLGNLSEWGGLINAGPPPDPYGILSRTKYPFGRFKFDAYDAVKQYDHPPSGGRGCSHPLRRPDCKVLGWEIHLLHGRRLFVAYHVLTSHGWVERHHAHWTAQTGPENLLLGRRETNRNPTWLS